MVLGFLPHGGSISESSKVRKRRRAEEEEAYAKMKASGKFLAHLELAIDGGLTCETRHLYKFRRIVPAITACVVTFLNIRQVVAVNLSFFSIDRSKVNDRLNLTEIILARWGHPHRFAAEELVACFEVVGLAALCCGVCMTLTQMYCGRSEFGRWLATARLFLISLPELKYFSAMRLMQHLLPYMIVQEFKAMIQDLKDRRMEGERAPRIVLEVVLFVLFRILIFIFGFDAFIVKFRTATEWASTVSLLSFLKITIFLNQTLGIVQVERITLQRLLLFIFGGEDNIVSPGEDRLMLAYVARLFERIWSDPLSSRFNAFVVSMTFRDDDLQRLMLNERAISVPGYGSRSNTDLSCHNVQQANFVLPKMTPNARPNKSMLDGLM